MEENPEYHQVVRLLIRLGIPLLQPGPSQLSGGSRGWCGWNLVGPPEMLQKPAIENPNTTLRECNKLRFITPAGPEELTLQALSP